MELRAKAHSDIVASVEIPLGHDRALIKSLQSLERRQNVGDLSLFYCIVNILVESPSEAIDH